MTPEEENKALAAAYVLREQENYWGAMDIYMSIVADNPRCTSAYNELAMVLKKTDRYPAALACARRASQYAPDSAEILCNVGNLALIMSEYEEAKGVLDRADAIKPDMAPILYNLGQYNYCTGNLPKALEYFERCIQLEPKDLFYQWDHALALLSTGDYTRGWMEYDIRYNMNSPRLEASKSLGFPRWLGENLEGKFLYVYFEQGEGDTLQFIRFLPLLKKKYQGLRILFHCQPPLARLLRNFDPEIEIQPAGEATPMADYHISLMSIPRLLDITLDNIPPAPYLKPPVDPTKPDFRSNNVNVAIAWAGSPHHKNNFNRSMPFDYFLALADVAPCRFFNMQVGDTVGRCVESGGKALFRDLSPWIVDYWDTAVFLSQMDLVICVDTSLVHLAGAMGIPVFAMLPHVPDWRWMRDRNDSPWYPSVRLFRQKEPGDWTGLMKEVKEALIAGIGKAE